MIVGQGMCSIPSTLHLVRNISLALLIALVSGVLAQNCSAQRYFFEGLTIQEGLQASKIYDVVQDKDGLVWIATSAGLASYDGLAVTPFGEVDGLLSDAPRTLALDARGRLIVGHFKGGLTVHDAGRFHAFSIPGLESDITGILPIAEDRLVITTIGQGAWTIQLPNDGTEAVRAERIDPEGDLYARLLGIRALRDGTALIIEEGGRIRTLDQQGALGVLQLPDLPSAFVITTVLESASGDLWVGTFGGGAFRFDASHILQDRFDLTNGLNGTTVMCFAEEASGRIWIGTSDGGLTAIADGGLRKFGENNGLHDDFVRCVSIDREGNLLIGTNESGLDIFKGERFISFTENDGLADPQVWAIMEDIQGRTWFGTNDGIAVLDEHDGKRTVRTIRQQDGKLANNFIRCLVQDDRGYIWIGTAQSGLERFGPDLNGSSLYEPFIELNSEIDGITALEVGQPGELWIGAVNGLWRYVPGSGTIPTRYSAEDGLAGEHVNAIYRDKQGTIWVGSTVGGVTRIDNGKAKPVDLGRSLSVTAITQDGEGRMWLGTEGQGVLVLEGDSEKQRFTIEQGLLSNTIKALGTDKQGHVWIGTNKGLNKWRPKKGGFITFTERAGFTGVEVKANAVCATSSGDIWFGTANGATRVGADKDVDRTIAPVVFLRRWEVNTEERLMDQNAVLPNEDRKVRIHYGSVSLSDPGAVRYQYRLIGLDNEVQPITRETEAYYPALLPGSYTFWVRAMDRTGEWSEPVEHAFEILPPWWQRWWAITAAVLLVAVSLFSYIKIRERQLRMRNQMLERKVKVRTAEVVAQSQEIESQKGRIEDLLLNILPKEISDELRDNGKATARLHEEVTVMFTDMKGFTVAAEKMTPQQLVNELDTCFIGFDEIMDLYGIEKIKTIGDSYMCAGGVPTADPFHAHKAVLAGLEVRELMERWRLERTARGEEPWVLRIGVHTGPVVAGVVGKRKFAYDIWGDTVNTASRMESSGKPGELNISGSTEAIVRDHFICEHRGKVEAKNKGMIDMYFVRRIRPEYSANAEGTIANALFLEKIGVALVEAGTV